MGFVIGLITSDLIAINNQAIIIDQSIFFIVIEDERLLLPISQLTSTTIRNLFQS